MIYLRYLWKEISYKGESIWNLALIGLATFSIVISLSFHIGLSGKLMCIARTGSVVPCYGGFLKVDATVLSPILDKRAPVLSFAEVVKRIP